jgi:hypothetical protein
MKKVVVLIVCVSIFQCLKAQDIQFGALGGINISGAHVKQEDPIKGSPMPGFELGVFADIPFTDKRFSFRPALMYSYEGYKVNEFDVDAHIHVSFIKLPMPVIYHSTVAQSKMFFGFGPFIEYGLSGKVSRSDINETDKILFGSDKTRDDLKRFDAGACFVVGYQLQDNLFLSGKFDLGLINISDYDAKISTRSFGVTVAYVLKSQQMKKAKK